MGYAFSTYYIRQYRRIFRGKLLLLIHITSSNIPDNCARWWNIDFRIGRLRSCNTVQKRCVVDKAIDFVVLQNNGPVGNASIGTFFSLNCFALFTVSKRYNLLQAHERRILLDYMQLQAIWCSLKVLCYNCHIGEASKGNSETHHYRYKTTCRCKH